MAETFGGRRRQEKVVVEVVGLIVERVGSIAKVALPPQSGTLRNFLARAASPRRLPAHCARADGLCARLVPVCACSLSLRRDRPARSSLPARRMETPDTIL